MSTTLCVSDLSVLFYDLVVTVTNLCFIATYGYAKQYSGVNLGSFVKHLTSSNLTAEGLRNVSSAVMQLAAVEGLDAHGRAVSIRMEAMNRDKA